jgi:hypothetical protein
MGVSLGGIGALVGGGSALAGLLGFGAQTPQAPAQAFVPQSLPTADAGAISGTQNLSGLNTAAGTLGQFGNVTQGLVNNPGASQFTAGANALSPVAGGAGMQQIGAGSNLINGTQGNLAAAQSALNTAFDPQNALYAQQYQQNNDATNAGLAARGLATTPYGAGVQNTSDQQFNTNWLQSQLQRQATGAQTASTLQGATGAADTTGAGLQTTGLNTALQGASLPFSTAQTIGTDQQQALSALGAQGTTATNNAQQQIADFLQYLGLGNQATGVNNSIFGNQITAQNNAFNQQQALGKSLGSSLSGLGTFFGGSGGTPGTAISGATGPTSFGGASGPTPLVA